MPDAHGNFKGIAVNWQRPYQPGDRVRTTNIAPAVFRYWSGTVSAVNDQGVTVDMDGASWFVFQPEELRHA